MSCGFRKFAVRNSLQKAAIPVAVRYPASASEQAERFGPYSLEAAVDAPVAKSNLPVVALSHGNGGSPWAYCDIAKHLAASGFVIVLPEHTGNGRGGHGEILTAITKLADENKLKPLLSNQHFTTNTIASAFDLVVKGSKGKVAIEF